MKQEINEHACMIDVHLSFANRGADILRRFSFLSLLASGWLIDVDGLVFLCSFGDIPSSCMYKALRMDHLMPRSILLIALLFSIRFNKVSGLTIFAKWRRPK